MKCLVYYLIYNLRILIYINSEYDSLRYISILLLMHSLRDYEIGDNDDEVTRTMRKQCTEGKVGTEREKARSRTKRHDR